MKVKKHNPQSYKRLICSVTWDAKSIQKSGDGALTIVGYANTRGKDRVGDVVLPEAFEKTLPLYMENPMLLYMHDWDKVAGKVIHAEIDEKGLKVKAKISGAKDCEDIRTKINEGVLSTFSIGYNELDADWEKETATNIVKEIELLEISIVSIPCNTEAKFTPVVDEEKEDKPKDPKSAPNMAEFEDGKTFLVDDSLRDFYIEKIGQAHNEGQSITKSLMKEWEMELCLEKKINSIREKMIENEIITILKDEEMKNLEKLENLIKELRTGKKVEEKKTPKKTESKKTSPKKKSKKKDENEDEKMDHDDDENEDEKMENDEESMQLIMQRLDMLGEGLASALEMLSMMGASEPKMDDEEDEDEKMDDEDHEEDDEEKSLEDMSDDEGIALLHNLTDEVGE